VRHFALTAAAFEGSLALLAVGLARLLGTPPPLGTFHADWRSAALGLAAAVPPLVLFWLCVKCPWRPFRRIAEILDEMIVPLFRDCRVEQLAIVALLAGLGEETLFRGVVQTGIFQAVGPSRGEWIALLGAACLFGLLHSITPTYVVLAALVGLYLGWLWLATGNLLVPITAHAAYDFFALLYLVKTRPSHAADPPGV
jgi:membrane protease YdiL (CAAX protease family)